MQISNNALAVLKARYLAKDEKGNVIEQPKDMIRRVAKTIAAMDQDALGKEKTEELEESLFTMMTNLEFLPNSPTLMNAGRPLGQLSACFVLPIEDSMEGIFDSVKHAALIHKSGGGTGFSFSRIRSKGQSVKTTGGVASGPISFMKVFNAATEAIKQGGVRRGANMGILRVDHPDIREFITCKQDDDQITNFNISIGLTEAFMAAVARHDNYNLVDPVSEEVVRHESAKEIFDLIIDHAWCNGEPGIIFLDKINAKNPTPALGEIESTNPCGEQPLLPYEACNLGSINLSTMTKLEGRDVVVDYKKLGDTVKKAVHFLDNVIDANKYPLDKIDAMTRGTRKIGLGVMGWADMLFMLKIPYNSEEAIELASKVMGYIQKVSKEASEAIAKDKGVFPYYEDSIYDEQGVKMRNATTTTIAPTGTLSIIANTSSGVEPLFAISYIRNIMDNQEFVEVNPIFKKIAMERGFYSDALMKQIADEGSIQHINEIPDDVKRIFVTAHDVAPLWHVKMQAAFQEYTDNAVSKTVNLPHEATREDVCQVYMQAYNSHCKGITVYRDGSRDAQVLSIKELPKKAAETSISNTITPRERPEITQGFTEKVKIGCGNLYITVNYDENGICEVFTNLGRGGGCPSQSEATSRLVSVALRSGMDAKVLVEQLRGIRCPSTIRRRDVKVTSCPDAIARVIQKVMALADNQSTSGSLEAVEQKLPKDVGTNIPLDSKHRCPECNSLVEHEGGCMVCRNCGYSKCG